MAATNYARNNPGRQRRLGIDTRENYNLKARANALRGVELGQSKLNDDAIKCIRSAAIQRQKLREHIAATLSNEALAKEYKVHVRTIEKILTYETWSHII